jgi:hypothetical protein
VKHKLANLTILILGQKEVKFHKEISLFYDLNSIYSVGDLKHWNIKENNIFFDIPKLQNNQTSQLLVHATASYYVQSSTLFNRSVIAVCMHFLWRRSKTRDADNTSRCNLLTNYFLFCFIYFDIFSIVYSI